MKGIQKLLSAIVALSIGHSAYAAEYVFRVPVDLRDLAPQLTQLTIQCYLRRANGTNLGVGAATAQITGGSFQGLVTVEVSRTAGVTELPVSYECALGLNGTVDGANRIWGPDSSGSVNRLVYSGPTPRPPNLPEILPARSGTTPVTRVLANFGP